jgi:CheY-like chemotaxis protein
MNRKVFCIDDDEITLMLCKMVISKSSFSNEVTTALNGEEAITLLEKQFEEGSYPDLILLDLNMPVMNGWEFLDYYKKVGFEKKYKQIKIFILSSTIDPQEINKIKNYPFVADFLSKPISVEMIDKLKSLL